MKRFAAIFLLTALMLPGIALAEGKKASNVTITAAQVERGQAVYGEFCEKCHGDQLNNGQFGPPIKGDFFRDMWADKTVGDLFLQTVKTMPPDDPGFLRDQEYADIIAYILNANGLEPGGGELPGDPEALKPMNFPW